ncbi:hypothetical protein PR048_026245 [Dryococelus australis]|uniref:Uncharacterized protein n=1 Tax=Dryococelus australis TaxID=614101 RepID=A0ABQ9GKU9_9NEOP|nr:hypothetical protein PR048_026245 [Dryococelus australis]
MSKLHAPENSLPQVKTNGEGKVQPILLLEGVNRTPVPLQIKLKVRDSGEIQPRDQVLFTPVTTHVAETQSITDQSKPHTLESTEVLVPDSEFEDLCVDFGQIEERLLEKEHLRPEKPDRKIKSPEPPPKVFLVLRETDTIFLLERPSLTEIKGTPEGDLVEKDNEYYEYITKGKGSLRYKSNAEVQTAYSALKNKSCMASPCETRDTSVSASSWDYIKLMRMFSGVKSLPH